MEPIRITGLKQNNLKNISVEIPKNRIVVFTGVSGSGKSSIVFDTIAAESQRQMNETYSAWVRGRLPKYHKPDVERIENLNPSVIIDQSRLGGNARSTVGTISDMYSLLRLLFSRIGNPYVGSASSFSFNNPPPTTLFLHSYFIVICSMIDVVFSSLIRVAALIMNSSGLSLN